MGGHRRGYREFESMTGIKIHLPKGTKIKDGKVEKPFNFRDASHKIACRKSKKVRVQKRTV